MKTVKASELRMFDTGAIRDSAEGKLDFEGFLHPKVLECYAQYMHKHRVLPNGDLRDSDNWQNGIPLAQYMKSLWRHFFAAWSDHRGFPTWDEKTKEWVTMKDALCGVIFNASGYLYEILMDEMSKQQSQNTSEVQPTVTQKETTTPTPQATTILDKILRFAK